MTTYSAILNSEIDPDSPITTGLMTKYRDNPLAIQEGDASASGQRIQHAALANDAGWWVPVAELDITTSTANVDLLTPFDNSIYGAYKITGVGIAGVTGTTATLNAQFSRDGSSIVTTDVISGMGSYISTVTWTVEATYITAGATQGAGGIVLCDVTPDDSNAQCTQFEMFISNELVRNSGLTFRHDFPMFSFWASSPNRTIRFKEFVGNFKGTGAGGQLIDGVRIKLSTGNVQQGRFILYGMRYVP